MILSILFLIIVIAITSSLIVFCTLYVSTTSSCANYHANTSLAQAVAGNALFCYCNANFHLIYVDSSIQNACTNIERDILVSNVLLVGASVVSTITNVILIVIVTLIA